MTTIQSSSIPQCRSLQKTLAAAAVAVGKDSVKQDDNPGVFENSFSSGLDLSEFTTTSKSSDVIRTVSASSQLLRIKNQEKDKRRQEEREDLKMEQLLQKRLAVFPSFDDTITKKSTPPYSATAVMDALVQMHGRDETYKRPNPGKGGTSQKSLLRKICVSAHRHPSRRPSNSSKQRVVTKKSKRIKY
jgi:hypothetical protein